MSEQDPGLPGAASQEKHLAAAAAVAVAELDGTAEEARDTASAALQPTKSRARSVQLRGHTADVTCLSVNSNCNKATLLASASEGKQSVHAFVFLHGRCVQKLLGIALNHPPVRGRCKIQPFASGILPRSNAKVFSKFEMFLTVRSSRQWIFKMLDGTTFLPPQKQVYLLLTFGRQVKQLSAQYVEKIIGQLKQFCHSL